MSMPTDLDPTTPTAKSVVIVDDHPMFRSGLVAALSREPGLSVIATAGSLDEAVQAASTTPIDLAMVDILLPGGDGIAITRALCLRGVKVLGLSALHEPIRIVEMLRAGAAGFAHKTQPITDIVEAIRVTLDGGRYLWPAIRVELELLLGSGAKLPFEQLTRREREIFGLLVRGHSNEGAARELGIAPRTVETHRQSIMKKLDAHTIGDLVRLAAKLETLG